MPKVLWVQKGTDHFVAAPVPAADRVIFSGLAGFNQPIMYAFNAVGTGERIGWRKSAPLLKLPTVSSPAVHDGKLFFGDGMHQTDGAILHCLRADKGQPLWELPLPGTLVHLEGSPTLVAGKLYLGGGSAGVICVDVNRITLEGKELTLAAIQKILEDKWAALLAQYEKEKKTDPDAVPPSEDQLPKPAPVMVWQQGKDKWHVDAPVTVVGDLVLVASAFLDKEMVGDRALFALDAKTGEIRWRAALGLNPWGGPSVQGKTVVVTGSNIGYDVKALKGAKGEVAAFNLADGKELWRKPVPGGGVVSCAALTDDSAVVTATDGKVRAFDLASGERRWIYDAKTPFFAPPAIAGDVAYAGDLKGVIHAITLKDGGSKWNLDLGADPVVKSPGAFYGGPIVHGGKIYAATCNLEGAFARQPTAVVCIGAP
jgi:outer membrane protein assembly factor BamB